MERFDIAVGTPDPKADVLLVYGIWANSLAEATAKLLASLSRPDVQVIGVVGPGYKERKEARAKLNVFANASKN